MSDDMNVWDASMKFLTGHTSEAGWMLYFFFNDTATTEIYTLSLHDALPIYIFIR